MKISVATCHFPVDADVRRNLRHVVRQMRTAKKRGAHVAHFPEACLCGYAVADFEAFQGFDWQQLEAATRQVVDLAREIGLWVILGSAHRLTGRHKPHDSIYVISDRGVLVDRYDKMCCSEDDLAHYTPGHHFAVFSLLGVRCGVLICADYVLPELYREYRRRGVQLMFHSYHAGHASPQRVRDLRMEVGAGLVALNKGASLPEIRMPAAMQTAAHSNQVWISCANTSARHSCFPSFSVRPDGLIAGRLRRNIAGVLMSTVNIRKRPYAGTVGWRAMRGVFHTGKLVRDKRSDDRARW